MVILDDPARAGWSAFGIHPIIEPSPITAGSSSMMSIPACFRLDSLLAPAVRWRPDCAAPVSFAHRHRVSISAPLGMSSTMSTGATMAAQVGAIPAGSLGSQSRRSSRLTTPDGMMASREHGHKHDRDPAAIHHEARVTDQLSPIRAVDPPPELLPRSWALVGSPEPFQ